ncbi:hypothetical protein DV737_g2553, partial [Chaetothyriales sp. CBS 132003]
MPWGLPAKNILIFGATGVIGNYITRAIVDSKHLFERICVFTSEKTIIEKVQDICALESWGVEVFVGRLEEEQKVKEAYQGIDTVVSCVGRAGIEKQISLISWAEECGVRRFFASEYGTDIEYWPQSAHEPPHQLKLKVRAHMRTMKKIEHTYLVTGPYSDLYFGPMKNRPELGSFNVEQKKAVLLGDGDGPVSFTAMVDVGKFVVAALLNGNASKNATLIVHSFTATPHEILAEFEEQTGTKWDVSYTPLDRLKEIEREEYQIHSPLATVATLRRIWTEGGTLYKYYDESILGSIDTETMYSQVTANITRQEEGGSPVPSLLRMLSNTNGSASTRSAAPAVINSKKRKVIDDDDKEIVKDVKRTRASNSHEISAVQTPGAIRRKAESKLTINKAPTNRLDIYVFGAGEMGELGLGRAPGQQKVKRPRLNPLLTKAGVVILSVGGMHTAALTSDNRVLTWGVNDDGALGRNTDEEADDDLDSDTGLNFKESTPDQVDTSGLPAHIIWAHLACTDSATFALTSSGEVYGWGSFRAGIAIQIGDGGESVVHQPTIVKSLRNFGKIICINGGSHHTVAVTDKGELLVWGRLDGYQLGLRLSSLAEDDIIRDSAGHPRILKNPSQIAGINAVFASAGSDHCVAVTRDGKAYAWGFSENYQTGLGTNKDVQLATQIDGHDQDASATKEPLDGNDDSDTSDEDSIPTANTETGQDGIGRKKMVWAGCAAQFSILAGFSAMKTTKDLTRANVGEKRDGAEEEDIEEEDVEEEDVEEDVEEEKDTEGGNTWRLLVTTVAAAGDNGDVLLWQGSMNQPSASHKPKTMERCDSGEKTLPSAYAGAGRHVWTQQMIDARQRSIAAYSADLEEYKRARVSNLLMTRRELRGDAAVKDDPNADKLSFVRHLDTLNYFNYVSARDAPTGQEVYDSKRGYWRYSRNFLLCMRRRCRHVPVPTGDLSHILHASSEYSRTNAEKLEELNFYHNLGDIWQKVRDDFSATQKKRLAIIEGQALPNVVSCNLWRAGNAASQHRVDEWHAVKAHILDALFTQRLDMLRARLHLWHNYAFWAERAEFEVVLTAWSQEYEAIEQVPALVSQDDERELIWQSWRQIQAMDLEAKDECERQSEAENASEQQNKFLSLLQEEFKKADMRVHDLRPAAVVGPIGRVGQVGQVGQSPQPLTGPANAAVLGSVLESDEFQDAAELQLADDTAGPRRPVPSSHHQKRTTASSIGTPKTEPQPSRGEMHPKTVHPTTAEPDSGFKLGFVDIDDKSRRQSVGIQNTPCRAQEPVAKPFTFNSDSQLSENAKKLMAQVRADAAKIKAELAAEREAQHRKDQDAEQMFDRATVSGRKIAQPRSKAGRFSDVHMAQFRKMDSIANHASAFRAKPGFIRPTAQSLKRSGSKAELDAPERPRTAGKGTHASASPFKSILQTGARSESTSPAKRARRSEFEDVSASRPAAADSVVPSPPALLAKSNSSLFSPTKASLARSGESGSVAHAKPSMLPRSNSAKSVKPTPRASRPRFSSASVSRFTSKLLEARKEVQDRTTSQSTARSKPLPALPTEAPKTPTRAGTVARPASSLKPAVFTSKLPTLSGLRSILRSPQKTAGTDVQSQPSAANVMPESAKKVDFTPSVKSRYAVKLAATGLSAAKGSREDDDARKRGPIVPYDPAAYVVEADSDETWEEEVSSPVDYPVLPPIDASDHADSFIHKARDDSGRESREFKSIFTTLHPPKPALPATLAWVNTGINKTKPTTHANQVVRSPSRLSTRPSPPTIRRVRPSVVTALVQPFEDSSAAVMAHGLPAKKRRRASDSVEPPSAKQAAAGNRGQAFAQHVPGRWSDHVVDNDADDEGDRRGGKRARTTLVDEGRENEAPQTLDAAAKSPVKKSAAREQAAKHARDRKTRGKSLGGLTTSRLNALARPKSRA